MSAGLKRLDAQTGAFMKMTFPAALFLLIAALSPAGAAERLPERPDKDTTTFSPQLLAQNNAAKSSAKKSSARGATELKYFDSSEATGSSAAVIVGQNHLAHTAQLLPVNLGRKQNMFYPILALWLVCHSPSGTLLMIMISEMR